MAKPRADTQFYIGNPCRRGHDGLRYKKGRSCVTCMSLNQKARYATPEGKQLKLAQAQSPRTKRLKSERSLLVKYDMTKYGWNFKLAGQQFRCDLCGTDNPRHVSGWHTDHCHETGMVRGILCAPCNMALGILGDTPESMDRAHLYTKGQFSWTQRHKHNYNNSPTPTVATAGHSNHWPNIAQVETLYIPLSLAM